MVEAYGSPMPLNQVGTISVPEPRMITVQVWDRGWSRRSRRRSARPASASIPQTEGQIVRVPIPELSQERRKELTKVAHKYAEQARVAVRNVRRDGMEALKSWKRTARSPRTSIASCTTKIQQLTDEHIKQIDEALAPKKKRSCRSE